MYHYLNTNFTKISSVFFSSCFVLGNFHPTFFLFNFWVRIRYRDFEYCSLLLNNEPCVFFLLWLSSLEKKKWKKTFPLCRCSTSVLLGLFCNRLDSISIHSRIDNHQYQRSKHKLNVHSRVFFFFFFVVFSV